MLITFLVFSCLVVLAAVAYWLLLPNPKEEAFLTFRCPQCSQKIRYLAHKAGKHALCPRCMNHWTLPMDARTETSASTTDVISVGARLVKSTRANRAV
jgi:phage FluMu protein Com